MLIRLAIQILSEMCNAWDGSGHRQLQHVCNARRGGGGLQNVDTTRQKKELTKQSGEEVEDRGQLLRKGQRSAGRKELFSRSRSLNLDP